MDGSAASEAGGRRDVTSTGPQAAVSQASAASGAQVSAATSSYGSAGPGVQEGFGSAMPSAPPGAARPAPAGPRRPATAQSRFALSNWRVRWRLVAVIAVPTLTAAILGSLQIYGDVSNWSASGRVQHLAQLNTAVVQLTQALEDERDTSAGYVAAFPDRASPGGPTGVGSALAGDLAKAENATTADEDAVNNLANGVDVSAGYQPTTVQDLTALTDSLEDLGTIRHEITTSATGEAKIIQVYTENIITPANTFSTAVGTGANDADLQGNVATLAALMRTENEISIQRGVLYAALSSPKATLPPGDVTTLQQAIQQQLADEADFTASTGTAEVQNFSNTVAGTDVDLARSAEDLAQAIVTRSPTASLTSNGSGLRAGDWYKDMSVTVGDTRKVADQLTASITARANTLRSNATEALLVTSLVTLVLLLLVLLVSTFVARSLIRPLRKLRSDALDVAGHRLPEMVRRLSQSEGTDEGVDIEPIGVTSTDEIGEVARAFDQVHREAVRLAADEAMLRGNLNAMFINLSRRSQSLIERQLSLIDSLEQSEQDSGRLSSLFRLDHLATRMRRNSENLLVLAGHEVTRRWSQPVALVDVLRAAISEIEQYERVVLNVQPGIVVVGQAVNDAVHLVAEIVENATTFSPEDTQVYVSGQPLSSGGVLLDITDNGVGISDQEMSHANWRLDNPPVVDVAVSRRMGLFVVGRLAARHGVRVRLRHAQAGGLTALIWLPDTVAAPEVAAPLGRLRRFEADDFGPTPSLSAPTQTAASQATAAARIPRFSPTPSNPSAPPVVPAQPSAPSLSPAMGSSWPAAPSALSIPPGQSAPLAPSAHSVPPVPSAASGMSAQAPQETRAQAPQSGQAPLGPQETDASGTGPQDALGGLGDGGMAAARSGWDMGGAWDDPGHQEPQPPALPVRNGHASTPAKGSPAVSAEPVSSAGSGDGGRLPAFGGLSSQGPQFTNGSHNVHGSDGPSASGPATGPNGLTNGTNGSPGLAGNGSGPDDPAAESGRVTIPPPGPHEPRLPIFDSLESDWFRSGDPVPAAQVQGLPAGNGSQAAASVPSATQGSWTSPSDEGWRAAQAVAEPAAGDTTQAGLPRRVPRANLVPGSVGGGGGAQGSQESGAEAPVRSPDAIRSRMSSFQRGVREGRAAAPPQTEES